MNIEIEKMSDEFTKYHIKGLPFNVAIHHFTGADKGLPHDHPWGFISFVLKGSYVERVFRYCKEEDDWEIKEIFHGAGDVIRNSAEHIHQIIDLPQGECWTLVLPEPWKRQWGFWDFSKPIANFIPFTNGTVQANNR